MEQQKVDQTEVDMNALARREFGAELDTVLGPSWRFTRERPEGHSIYTFDAKWRLYKDEKDGPVALFSLVKLPGCCGVCVSYWATVLLQYRHKGLGKLLNNLRIHAARASGYTVMLCTDVTANIHQRQILAANGWHDIYTFTNRRSKNQVNISVVAL
jgi:hypothetical protein